MAQIINSYMKYIKCDLSINRTSTIHIFALDQSDSRFVYILTASTKKETMVNNTCLTLKSLLVVTEQSRGSLQISSRAPAKSTSDTFPGTRSLANSSLARGLSTGSNLIWPFTEAFQKPI